MAGVDMTPRAVPRARKVLGELQLRDPRLHPRPAPPPRLGPLPHRLGPLPRVGPSREAQEQQVVQQVVQQEQPLPLHLTPPPLPLMGALPTHIIRRIEGTLGVKQRRRRQAPLMKRARAEMTLRRQRFL